MLLPQNDESLPISRYPNPVVGRLIAMPTTEGNMTVEGLRKISGWRTGVIAFDFPSMPDVIELARSADYYTNYSPVMPDGMHQYRGTKPLEIPLSFRLHAMDKTFCPYGSLTLLQLASRLHSFVLPITPDGSTGAVLSPLLAGDLVKNSQSSPQKSESPVGKGGSTDTQVYDTALNTPVNRLRLGNGQFGTPYPPVTCMLSLIWVAENQPGIACMGYVRDVRVKLMGPWLRGPTGEFNLPSAGEFEFTFIHRPSHNNSAGFSNDSSTGQFNMPSATSEIQAYATDVRNQLYNTRNLVYMANYHGFNKSPTSARVKTSDLLNSSEPPQYVPEPSNVTNPPNTPNGPYTLVPVS